MQPDPQLAQFKRLHRPHWQCQMGDGGRGPAGVDSACHDDYKRIRILTANCQLEYSCPHTITSYKPESIRCFCYKLMGSKADNRAKSLVLPEGSHVTWPLHISGFRGQVDTADPGLLSQQAHCSFSICWKSRTETEEEHGICNGNPWGQKATPIALTNITYLPHLTFWHVPDDMAPTAQTPSRTKLEILETQHRLEHWQKLCHVIQF